MLSTIPSTILSYLKTHTIELLAWLAIALAPITGALLTVAALLAMDLVTGVWAAKKRGEAITSNGFRRTLVKIAIYEGALVLGYAVEVNLLQGAIPLVKIIGGWIGLTELKSNAENLYAITGYDIWQALLTKLAGVSSAPGVSDVIPPDPSPTASRPAPTSSIEPAAVPPTVPPTNPQK